jgi:hypothetical protein
MGSRLFTVSLYFHLEQQMIEMVTGSSQAMGEGLGVLFVLIKSQQERLKLRQQKKLEKAASFKGILEEF